MAANLDRGIIAKQLTNRAVAAAVNSTEAQVWRWRRGRHVPSLETLTRLATLLFDGDVAEFYVQEDAAA